MSAARHLPDGFDLEHVGAGRYGHSIHIWDLDRRRVVKLTSSVNLGGLFEPATHPNGTRLTGGPQMLQLSMDGRRLYVTNSLSWTWDNQFHPDLRGWMLKLDAGDDGLRVDPGFFVDSTRLGPTRSTCPGRPHHRDLQPTPVSWSRRPGTPRPSRPASRPAGPG